MGWIVAATCTFLLRATWIRRWSLFNVSDRVKLRERTLTVALLLQAIALFLMTPASDETVGRLLHAITGIWNLDTWVGDCLYIAAAGLVGINVSSRLRITDDDLRNFFSQRFALPMTIVVNVLLALLVMSPAASTECPDMFRCPTDHWLDAYWSVFCGFLIWVLINTMRAALLLRRRNPSNRRPAAVYIAALVFAISCCVVRIVTTWTDDSPDEWFWLTNCAAGMLLAHVAAWAWRQQVRRMSEPG